MKCRELDFYLRNLLHISDFSSSDCSLNGLQVGDLDAEIQTCAFAVDACQETIDQAVKLGADLLFVHHGLFWGSPIAITSTHYNRVKALLDNHLALFACHLPLDAHPFLGNNAELSKVIGLQALTPFGTYKGQKIGFKGTLPASLSIEEILQKLGIHSEDCLSILPFGPTSIQSIGIISGGASNEVEEAIKEELDLYITGESSHQIYHTCLENKINLIAAGHYFTETFGVKAVAQYLEKELHLKTLFIHCPTNL